MKVLVFTNLYPNNVWPNHGVFTKERMSHVVKLDGCEVQLVAPVPYFPAVKVNSRWQFSQVAPQEARDGTRSPDLGTIWPYRLAPSTYVHVSAAIPDRLSAPADQK